jgi:hypothetical protein
MSAEGCAPANSFISAGPRALVWNFARSTATERGQWCPEQDDYCNSDGPLDKGRSGGRSYVPDPAQEFVPQARIAAGADSDFACDFNTQTDGAARIASRRRHAWQHASQPASF